MALAIPLVFLTILSLVTLKSIAASLFPTYFIYTALGLIAFFVFSKVDFEITATFSRFYYLGSIFLLIVTLLIGSVTRGAIRWIPLGSITIQPAEIIRPFLIVFFAVYFSKNILSYKTLLRAFILLFIPLVLILIQPSLAVSLITILGFIGVVMAVGFNKKILLLTLLLILLLAPFIFLLLAPYQKDRVQAFLNPEKDPLGTGYNSIQSMIAVGSGKIFGRGLGQGAQTQLAFLPERQTDFIFASVAEEMGFVGTILVSLSLVAILWRLTYYIANPASASARAYLTGIFLTLTAQSFVNIAMNIGLMPVAGLPLPVISAGGSSYLATLISLGIASSARKKI